MTGKQLQKAGSNSTLQQAETIHNGISYADARDIALDVFRNNFMQLADDAHRVATERVERVTERFLKSLLERDPMGLAAAREPDMQRALFRVQSEAACSTDEYMNDVLVDVLVERTKEREKSLRRIILDEALLTIPKLTRRQLSTLSIAFYFMQVQSMDLSPDTALNQLRSQLRIFIEPLDEPTSETHDLRHLEYAGCLSLSVASSSIGSIYSRRYPGLFCRGIKPTAIEDRLQPAFVPHPTKTDLLYIPVPDEVSLIDYLSDRGLSDDKDEIWHLVKTYQMPEVEIRTLLATSPYVERILTLWDESNLESVQLTSVGTAIGHANLRRLSPFDAGLEIWFPE